MSKTLRILIVDDDRMMVKTLRDIFRVKGYEAEVAYSAPEALEKIEQSLFDCVLSDIKMPEVNGVELYKAIRAKQPNLPVVLMTAYAIDKLIEQGLAEGAIAALTKPLDLNLLLAFLSSLRRKRSIVIIDDDLQFCLTLRDILQARGLAVIQITGCHDVVEELKAEGQIILLDMKLEHPGGLDVLRKVKIHYPHLPVVLVTDRQDEMTSTIETALEIGPYTYFHKPLQVEALLKVLTRIHHQELGRMLGRPGK